MALFEYIIVFVFGLLVGSFLNVVIYRTPKKLGVGRGRSRCTACGHELRGYDLIPVFSYIFLRGSCRYCGSRISARYPVVELLNALLYVGCLWSFGLGVPAACWCAASSVLIIIAFIDIDYKLIPDRFVVALAVCGALITLHNSWLPGRDPQIGAAADHLAGAFIVSVPFLLIGLISRGKAMGAGDVKLMAAAGLCLGWQAQLAALFCGVLSASIVSPCLIILKKQERGEAIPFAPYLAFGIVLSALFGDHIISWYIGLLK